MTSDEKTPNIKIVDLEKLQNFVVHNFFIWNHLGPQIYIFIQTIYRIIQSSNAIEHKDYCGAVVRAGGMRGCEFESHRLRSAQKIPWLVQKNGGGWA